MLYFIDKMIKLKIEDIIFWILIIATIAVILWKLFGSPSDLATIIAIGTFLLSSEILIWKTIFKIDKDNNLKVSQIDKKTSLGFMKVKHDIEKMRFEMNHRFNNIENKLNEISKKL